MDDKRYQSRKFLLACVALLAACGAGIPMVCYGLMTPDQWTGFVQWILGLYFTANVTQKAAEKLVR